MLIVVIAIALGRFRKSARCSGGEQVCGGFRFDVEAFDARGGGEFAGKNHFERGQDGLNRLAGPVNHAHPTPSNLLDLIRISEERLLLAALDSFSTGFGPVKAEFD
jgi:hypothetical protein